MNFAEYQAIQAVNFSSLKMMRESPLHYQHAIATVRKETPSLHIGHATHCAILEPERFFEEYAPQPDFGDGRTKEAKSLKADWLAQNAGKEPISFAEHTRLLAMQKAVRAHPDARDLLALGYAEVTLQWQDPYTRLACKGRVDWLRDDAIVGLKTTKSNNFRSFQRSVEDYGYLLQWAWYYIGALKDASIKVLRPEMFEICVESSAPHDVIVYKIPQDLIEDAIDENRELLNRVAECTKSGIWPGRAPGIVEFRRAAWAQREVEEEIDLEGCAA